MHCHSNIIISTFAKGEEEGGATPALSNLKICHFMGSLLHLEVGGGEGVKFTKEKNDKKPPPLKVPSWEIIFADIGLNTEEPIVEGPPLRRRRRQDVEGR